MARLGGVGVLGVGRGPPPGRACPGCSIPLLAPGPFPRRVTLLYEPYPAEAAAAEVEREISNNSVRSAFARRTRRDETQRERDDHARALQAAREEAEGAGVGRFTFYVTTTIAADTADDRAARRRGRRRRATRRAVQAAAAAAARRPGRRVRRRARPRDQPGRARPPGAAMTRAAAPQHPPGAHRAVRRPRAAGTALGLDRPRTPAGARDAARRRPDAAARTGAAAPRGPAPRRPAPAPSTDSGGPGRTRVRRTGAVRCRGRGAGPPRGGGRAANVEGGAVCTAPRPRCAGCSRSRSSSGAAPPGVPIGRHMHTAEPVGLDPAEWLRQGLVSNTGSVGQGQPGIGKSTIVKRLMTGPCRVRVDRGHPRRRRRASTARWSSTSGGRVWRIGRGLHCAQPARRRPAARRGRPSLRAPSATGCARRSGPGGCRCSRRWW